jgi:hypothetical protein
MKSFETYHVAVAMAEGDCSDMARDCLERRKIKKVIPLSVFSQGSDMDKGHYQMKVSA